MPKANYGLSTVNAAQAEVAARNGLSITGFLTVN